MQPEVLPAWEEVLSGALSGAIMLLGAPDTGKSTLARYLYVRLAAGGQRVACLDGDPGQTSLGPPATMTLVMGTGPDYPPSGRRWRRFVGAVSPRGHMLPMLVGAAALAEVARNDGADALIYDTSGLVDPAQGGTALKLAKIDLLRPGTVIAIQREDELEPLLEPLRRCRWLRLHKLRPSPAVEPRDPAARRARRAERFAAYFRGARPVVLGWDRLACLPRAASPERGSPAPDFVFRQLVALEDAGGFILGLGIVHAADIRKREVTLLTPLASPDGVEALRLGDLTVDARTYQDQRINESANQRVADGGWQME
jgi:polynucleotide 5'-hydroxyl-kinase GRC3/NOL9